MVLTLPREEKRRESSVPSLGPARHRGPAPSPNTERGARQPASGVPAGLPARPTPSGQAAPPPPLKLPALTPRSARAQGAGSVLGNRACPRANSSGGDGSESRPAHGGLEEDKPPRREARREAGAGALREPAGTPTPRPPRRGPGPTSRDERPRRFRSPPRCRLSWDVPCTERTRERLRDQTYVGKFRKAAARDSRAPREGRGGALASERQETTSASAARAGRGGRGRGAAAGARRRLTSAPGSS